jgi:hypothetical protein
MRSLRLTFAAAAVAAAAVSAVGPAAASAKHDGYCPPGSDSRDYCEHRPSHRHHHDRWVWWSDSNGQWLRASWR